jgi:5-methylcytosine-specific restriction endonuclease McrA
MSLTVSPAQRRQDRRDLAKLRNMAWNRVTCWYCGCLLDRENRSRDHVQPACKGGSNSPDNIVECCQPCNGRKRSLTLEEYRARCYVRTPARRSARALRELLDSGELHERHVAAVRALLVVLDDDSPYLFAGELGL